MDRDPGFTCTVLQTVENFSAVVVSCQQFAGSMEERSLCMNIYIKQSRSKDSEPRYGRAANSVVSTNL